MTEFDAGAAAMLRDLFAGRSALVLEDEPELGEPIRAALSRAGFEEVLLVGDGEAALREATGRRFDVLLLDRLNPGMDGLEVLRRIRAGDGGSARSPALVVTALGTDGYRVEGLVAGADDYIPKPVEEREVVLRVAAQLARRATPPRAAEPDWISYGPLRLNPAALVFEYDGKPIQLGGGLPFKIVHALMEAQGVPLSHGMLWDRCWTQWTFRPETFVNVVDTRISRLRKLIAEQMPPHLAERDSVIAKVWLEGFVVRDLTGFTG